MGFVIGLTGLAGSGKSTASHLLMSKVPGSVRIPVASCLKDMAMCLGLTEDMVYGDKKMMPIPGLGDVTPRYILQTLGTDWGRNMIHPNIWVLSWRAKVRKAFSDGASLVVVDDVRFPNEASTIREMGGKLIRISSTRVIQMTHESERHISGLSVDRDVTNNGSMDELGKTIVSVAKELLEG